MSTEEEATPRIIADRFEVVRVLGEGASARTLLCRERQQDRQVALKELHVAHLDDWKHLELFEREAKVLAGLRHHAIPQIFESLEQEDGDGRGSLILVQEFIDGASLGDRMDNGPTLGQVEVIQLTLGILDVLEYLHGRSPPIYHRDIKPSNIVVRPSGAPVLVDFGSVTSGWRPAAAAGSTVTGTFGYMPPEQLLGQVGPTSDLYALGATLLHLLTGRSPTEFPFDSGRIEVPDDLPASGALHRLVRALLEPAPNNRPASVKEARAILLEQTHAPTTALAVMAAGPPAITGSDGPQHVDVGPPPREPDGAYRDVYDLLTQPLSLFNGTHSPAGIVLRTLGVFAISAVTFGVVPTIYYVDRSRRRKKYDEVFRLGKRTLGTIVAVTGNQNQDVYATISFEFMAGTVKCRGYISYPIAMQKFLAVGDSVPVLYLEADPTRSCVVFRPGTPGG
ncbi:MAG: serine/threonine protein kinase [Deltaproteobacteria bacterium]|nr:serine/threonine protein kinase [Deltaproteobacteria bacterium]